MQTDNNYKKQSYTILTYEDYKTLCGKLKIGDKIKHKGWSNVTTIDIIGDNMCLEPREKIYVSCEVAIHEENVDWKATYYANLKGDQTMTKINDNYYKDGLRVTYEDDYIRVFKQFGTFILFDLFIGKDNLTFEQANEMLKPFGIIIEPKEATDWTRVEVGTKLKFTDWRVYGKITFKEWIEQTQQIIVFNCNKVEVYNEDEVELIWNY